MKRNLIVAVGIASIVLCGSNLAIADTFIEVNGAAALTGSFGLEAIADGTPTSAWVQDDSPNDEVVYRASFSFDVNSMSMIVGGKHIVFSGGASSPNGNKAAITIQIKRKASGFAIRAMSQVTAGRTRKYLGDIDITDEPHEIVVEWTPGTEPGVADGMIRMTVDGVTTMERTDVRSYGQTIKNAKLGLLAGSVDATTTGSHYFDDFASFRTLGTGP